MLENAPWALWLRRVARTMVKSAKSKGTRQQAQSLADIAYAAIEEMIVSRQLMPGAMISEGQIGEDLGMGRTPVREAISRLKHIGFVEVHPRRAGSVQLRDAGIEGAVNAAVVAHH